MGGEIFMKIGICDNNLAVANDIKTLLEPIPSLQTAIIHTYSSSESLFFACDEETHDIIFIEIELGNESGIKVAEDLKNKYPDVQIIFMSTGDNYNLEVYNVTHTYFLKKPIDTNKLADAMAKAIKLMSEQQAKYIPIKVRNNVYKTPVSQIVYMEKVRRVVMVYLANGKIYRTYGKFTDFLENLDDDFFQCHNSFLININYVTALDSRKFILNMDPATKNGAILEIPVSKTYYNESKAKFISHIQSYTK